tara:strand:+ start:2049 stop:2276 length:228 start_codon:yes stop_codon:yes gene_type:complete
MGRIKWRRSDLIYWGEYVETKIGRFRKRWVFTERATNDAGCLFYFCGKDGVEQGPFYEERDVDYEVRKILKGGAL